MPLSMPITPGTVDWTGENPGILLKDASGAFTAMALFFRVAWSPGRSGPGSLALWLSRIKGRHACSPECRFDRQHRTRHLP